MPKGRLLGLKDRVLVLCRQRGRGQMGAKSPLLWDKGQVDSLLAGSPVVNMVKERLKVLSCLPCCPFHLFPLAACQLCCLSTVLGLAWWSLCWNSLCRDPLYMFGASLY